MTMGDMIRHIQRLRLKYSVHEVLDIILPDLPYCSGVPAPNIITVLLAHDVYTVAELDYISQAVGLQPGSIAWSTMINNALRRSVGIQAALNLYVEACRRGCRVQNTAASHIISQLVNATKFYQPDPPSIRRAVAIFVQQMSTEDTDDQTYVKALPLLHALVSSTAIPDRNTHIRRILDWTKLRELPIDWDEPHLNSTFDSYLRCQSYSAAVSAVSRTADLSATDLKGLLGRIVRMRFEDEIFMPLSAFAAFMRHWESCGHDVDSSVILTYLAGLRATLHTLRVPWEEQAFRRRGGSLTRARRALEAHLYAFEAYVVDRYPAAADSMVYTALLYLLPTLDFRDDQLFEHFWAAVKRKSRTLSTHSICAALEAAPSGDEAVRLWADFVDSGASPSIEEWANYALALIGYSEFAEALSVITRHIGDDPEHPKAAISLFGRAKSDEDLARYAAALPRTWASPEVQRALARYREYRARIGRRHVGLGETS